MGRVMHPRLIVSTPGAVDGAGHLAVPRTVGPVRLWDVRFALRVGEIDGWEYRTVSDDLFVVARVATVSGRALAVLYVPTPEEGDDEVDARGLRAALSTIVARQWRIGTDRALVSELDADGGALATAVKAAWPGAWRRREAGDDPSGAPSGPRLLGVSLGEATGTRVDDGAVRRVGR